jgi:hypothetical protein
VRFIHRKDGRYSLDSYLAYLDEHAEKMPPGAREFAMADWHYDIGHHQCPHDSWLEAFSINENAGGVRHENSTVDIEASFLGSYHDGHFSLIYRDVASYSLQFNKRSRTKIRRAHGDWMIDEVTVTDANMLYHEIEFESATLMITCAELEYRWMAAVGSTSV